MSSDWARALYVLLLLTAVALLWVGGDRPTAGLVAIVGAFLGIAGFWYGERRGFLR